MDAPSSERLPVYFLSGGTGGTCERVVTAALAQFEGARVEVVLRPWVRTVEAACAVVEEAAGAGGVLFHTLVAPDVHRAVVTAAERLAVPAVDLLGASLAVLGSRLDLPRRNRPGMLYELQKERFDRIDAVDYTLAHDDGARVHDLADADVVLVGVSRASKSVTCFYLAIRGLRAANVPLVPGLPVPAELAALETRRVIGLTMAPEVLQGLRATRVTSMRSGSIRHYTDLDAIAAELAEAQSVMRQHRWRWIDVSYMAVEEVAQEIASRLGPSR